jgi:hypothetical protein
MYVEQGDSAASCKDNEGIHLKANWYYTQKIAYSHQE